MTTTYNYNNLDQITSATTTTDTIAYSYDGRGNLVQTNDSSLGITQYSYDGLDRLTGVTPPGGNEATYEYDADGRRTKQTIGSNVTNFVWDEASTYGDVVAETDGSSAIQASYVLAGEHLLQQKRGSTVSYYLQDGQGSVRELTDINGDITDKYSYNAYGTIYASTGSTVNQYRYAGQQLDDLTGLYSLRTRYYNPVDARFLSRDTINPELTDPTEFNRYIYALDSPISFSDPTGQMALVEEAELTKIPQKVRQPLILIGAQILADLAAIALALHQLLNPLPFPFPVPNPNPNPTPNPTPNPSPTPRPCDELNHGTLPDLDDGIAHHPTQAGDWGLFHIQEKHHWKAYPNFGWFLPGHTSKANIKFYIEDIQTSPGVTWQHVGRKCVCEQDLGRNVGRYYDPSTRQRGRATKLLLVVADTSPYKVITMYPAP